LSGLKAVDRARSVPVVMSWASLGSLMSAMFQSSTTPVLRSGCSPHPLNASIVASELNMTEFGFASLMASGAPTRCGLAGSARSHSKTVPSASTSPLSMSGPAACAGKMTASLSSACDMGPTRTCLDVSASRSLLPRSA
jgi:hypothetical protein